MRRAVLGGLLCLGGWVSVASAEPFCDVLQEVVRSAEAGDRFAAVIGPDVGLYHEPRRALPGAKRCRVGADEYPHASWRCLMQSEGKYTLAQRAHARWVGRVADCLGQAWQVDDARRDGFLKWAELTSTASVAKVRVTATASDVVSRSPHRLVISVLSPHPAARCSPADPE